MAQAVRCNNCRRRTLNPNGLCGVCVPTTAAAPTVPDSTRERLVTQAALSVPEPPAPARTIFTVPADAVAPLQARITRLARRAERMGVPPPEFEILEHIQIPRVGPDGERTGYLDEKVRVRVEGQAPKFNGWTFRAVIDHDPEADPDEPNVVHSIGDPDPDWRYSTNDCEHCGTVRDRRKIVVVAHDNGDERLVGSTCLHDFLGSTSPQAIATWAEMVTGLADMAAGFETGSGTGEPRWDPESILAWVAKETDEAGWCPRSQAGPGQATVDVAVQRMLDHVRGRRSRDGVLLEPDPPDGNHRRAAEEALEWACNIDPATPNDYLSNVRAVSTKPGWRARDLGLGGSIINAFKQDQRRAAPSDTGDRARAAGHFGTVGERATFVGQVTRKMTFRSDFGPRRLIQFETPDGHILTWWCTGENHPDEGRTYDVTATVKGHGEYRGIPQTEIQRARFSEI